MVNGCLKGFLSRNITLNLRDSVKEIKDLSVLIPNGKINWKKLSDNGKIIIFSDDYNLFPFTKELAGIIYVDSEIIVYEMDNGEFEIHIPLSINT